MTHKLDPAKLRAWGRLNIGPLWVPRDALAALAVATPALEVPLAPLAPASPVTPTLPRRPATAVEAPARAPAPAIDVPPRSVPRSTPAAEQSRPPTAPIVRAAPTDARAIEIAAMPWDELRQAVAGCTACALCTTRKQTVFGVGNTAARWMLVGEAPGAEEDQRGEPFVGQAGRLLDNMLAATGLTRVGEADTTVYIANVLKCRPPGNRNPEPAEVALCEPFLLRQVELVRPRVIVVMGRFAAQSLLRTDATIASLRGRVHQIEVVGRRVPVIVTYHPAYLLRNLADKAKSWADLCLARDVYERAGDAA